MQGLELLRAYLRAHLKKPAEKLITFVETGTLVTVPGTANKDCRLEYVALVYILGIKYDARYICWLVGEWMNTYQPNHAADDIRFEAEILNHDTVDLEFRLKINEDILVREDEAGLTFTSCFEGLQDTPARDVLIKYH